MKSKDATSSPHDRHGLLYWLNAFCVVVLLAAAVINTIQIRQQQEELRLRGIWIRETDTAVELLLHENIALLKTLRLELESLDQRQKQ